MFSEHVQELEAVAAAHDRVSVGGNVIGVIVESGGDGQQQQQVAKSDGEELPDVGGNYAEQPYYDSLVRNKLPKRPA